MKNEKKKVIAFIMTLSLAFSAFFSGGMVYGAETTEKATQSNVVFSDINGHWGENDINNAVKSGFVQGYEDKTFKPNAAVTRAEFVTMINKALKLRDENTVNLLFKDVKKTAWYYKDIQKASYAQYVSGVSDTNFMPSKNITREEAATMIARFLPKAGYQSESSLNAYLDITQLSNWAKPTMSVVVNKGYITGHANGKLAPKGTLTRAEAAKIIGKILEKETIIRNDVSIKKSGEVLQDNIYVGDITIEKSVGEGEASLENLLALSKVYVLGGGVNTVTMKDAIIIQLIVCKEGTKVRVLSDKGSTIHETFVFNDNLVVDSQGQGVDSGEGGYENIIYVKGTISKETAIKVASEIEKRIDSTGKITQEQAAEGAAAVISNPTTTVNDSNSITVTVESEKKTSNKSKGHNNNNNSNDNSDDNDNPNDNPDDNPDDSSSAEVPGAPTDVSVTAGDGQAIVSFIAPANNGGSDITEYIVHVYKDDSLQTDLTTSGTATSITVTGLTNGTTYTFKVVAKNEIGDSVESEKSNEAVPKSGGVVPKPVSINGLTATLSAITGDTCSCGLSKTSEGVFSHVVEFDKDGISGGDTVEGYAIYTPSQLQHLALHPESNAVLMNDLDFSGITKGAMGLSDVSTPMGALSGSGIYISDYDISEFENGNFVPIGSINNGYNRIFNGNGKTITGLIVSGNAVDYVGLFGKISSNAVVKNLTLSGVQVSGENTVGGVVGYNYGGTVSNVQITGAVSGNLCVGGITGANNNDGTIVNSYNAGAVSSNNYAGGVSASNYGKVSDSYNTGEVSGGDNTGGVVGYHEYGTIENCYNTGDISGKNSVGGVLGKNQCKIELSNSYNTGTVLGNNSVGGVIGDNHEGTVTNVQNTGKVLGNDSVGGVTGANSTGTIINSYNVGAVSSNNCAGGVVAYNSSTVKNSYNTGTINSKAYVGGVVGYNQNGSIENSYNTGALLSTDDSVGGVVGENNGGTITSCSWMELVADKGIGNEIGTTTFSAVDGTLDSIYTSISAITTSAGNAIGTISDIHFSVNPTSPITFSALQGAYIIDSEENSLLVTVSAISNTNITVATGSSLETLLTTDGIKLSPIQELNGDITYSISGLKDVTWVLVKAVNTNPMYNRTYIIKHNELKF